MNLHMLLVIILSVDIFIFSWAIGTYFGNRASKPYVDMINHIGDMDIPIGRKIDLMKRIRP